MLRSILVARFRLHAAALTFALLFLAPHFLRAEPLPLVTKPGPADFPLAVDGAAAPLLIESGLDPAVARAANDLATDIARVSSIAPSTLAELPTSARAVVLVGIAGHSPLLDRLTAAGKLDLRALSGAWESFVIQTVAQPFPGIDQALVIVGSDRRGAIYGLYEISAAIGVSPWHWWADVPVAHRDSLGFAAGTHRFGPPSVKYRGIFLNDEDWGLQPWAAKTFDPEYGDIGPKTYAKIFELLLRLKANTLWPAMHACTRAFNSDPANARLADAERIATLEQIFADQRGLIAQHIAPTVERVPQVFCAYKEVLSLYRQGLHMPDDVTIVWPDDNFGYIRNFATPAERTRTGGFGVYYHISYLGRPLSYLWLCTTPPALIWEEMRKAYDHGADRLWIVNVGDLKPAEIPTEFFLQMAWDIDRWHPANLNGFLGNWAARNFGPANAPAIAALLADYYRLNFPRKPEHLQWWLPKTPYRPSDLSDSEIRARLAAFADLRQRAESLRPTIPAAQQDAFFELVYYPLVGSALANERYFAGERGALDAARAADARLTAETRFFNEQVAGGKWRGFMNLEPASSEWASMRLAPWAPPPSDSAAPHSETRERFEGTVVNLPADTFAASAPGTSGAVWTAIPGLGRSGRALTVRPFSTPPRSLAEATAAPRLDYALTLPAAGTFTLQLHLLPTHPITGTRLRLAVAIDDATPQLATLEVGDGGPAWAQGVLAARRVVTVPFTVAMPGPHTVHIWGLDPGVILDQLVLDPGLRP